MNKHLIRQASLSIAALSLLTHISCFARATKALDAHVHGVSELTIAFEKQQLEFELRSPAVNILGFEHSAITAEEKTAVVKAELRLANHDEIFSFSGNDCLLNNQSIDLASITKSDDRSDIQLLDSHTHDDQHQYEQRMSEGNKHHEIIAKYRYRCKVLSTPPAITVSIFELFPGIQQIKTLWLTDTKQGFSVLDIHHRDIHLK